MSAFARAIDVAGTQFDTDVALVDVRPNLGPLNRAALPAYDFVVVPLGADLLSLQGLPNIGTTVRAGGRRGETDHSVALPTGEMTPVGYIVMRHSVTAGRPARVYSRWIARMPAQYRQYVLNIPEDPLEEVSSDADCLAQLKDLSLVDADGSGSPQAHVASAAG